MADWTRWDQRDLMDAWDALEGIYGGEDWRDVITPEASEADRAYEDACEKEDELGVDIDAMHKMRDAYELVLEQWEALWGDLISTPSTARGDLEAVMRVLPARPAA